VALARQDAATARDAFAQARALVEAGPARNPLFEMKAARGQGQAAMLAGDFALARRRLDEALAMAARPELDNPLERAHTLLALGLLNRAVREDATRQLQEAGDLFQRLRHPLGLHAVIRAAEAEAVVKPAVAAPLEARWNMVRGGLL
jgi:hypothetical protein